MSTFSIFLVLITIVCFLLVVVIMVQNPKGGGLSSSIGGSQMLGGVQKTTDFLDKSTWTLATLLLVLILLSNVAIDRGTASLDSKALDPDAQTTQPLPALPADTGNDTATPVDASTEE